ncbi:DUF4232 domain-containing protein [Streptomyces sp. NBC_01589]|uniref:DUF4232 domain-containing protein n=1 Tax=unclassified Streptomyces TaxID=2593676 RepID=UPI00386E417F
MTHREGLPNARRGQVADPGRRTGPGRIPLLVGAVLTTAALSACGAGGGTPTAPHTLPGSANPASGDRTAATTSPPTKAGPTTPPAASLTPAASGTNTSSGPQTAGASRCRTVDLRASLSGNDPGAGQENFRIVLTNRSGRTCTLYGFPGVGFVNSAGEQVTVDPERTTGQLKRLVPLAPGRAAWAALSFTDPRITGVATVTPDAVLITPPDETTSLKVHWTGDEVSNTGKASVPRIGSFQAGSGA